MRAAAVAGLLLLYAAACCAEPGKPFVYKTSAGQPQTIEVFYPPAWSPTGRVACVLLFHGGGWVGGDLSQFRPHCAYLASRGVVAATAGYRMLPKGDKGAGAGGENLRKRVCVTDAKSAIRWVKQHAGELGIDPQRLVVGGSSAGGHISVLATANPGLGDPADRAGVDTSVAAYLLFNPAFTAEDSSDPEVDVLRHLTPSFPPAILFFGTKDGWKPGSDAALEKLKALGSTAAELWTAEGQTHGFYREQPWRDLTLAAADRFLVKHGFLSGACPLPVHADDSRLVKVIGAEPLCEGLRSTTPLVLKQGGTAEQPAVYDGKGVVIDLGIDVTGHAWKKAGDIWTSDGPLLGREPLKAGQVSGLFLDELPLGLPRDLEAEKAHPDRKERCYLAPAKLRPGQMGYSEDGSLYFRWPTNKAPETTRLILPPKVGVSAVTIACSNIIVRNITARHAANDGFNIHGKWTGIRLENVRALSNADEGISAHDDVQMEVENAEVAWNGSTSGGVADVDRCVTAYRRCTVYDNLAAGFFLAGKEHTVTDCVISNQTRAISVAKGTVVRRERVEWRPGSATPKP